MDASGGSGGEIVGCLRAKGDVGDGRGGITRQALVKGLTKLFPVASFGCFTVGDGGVSVWFEFGEGGHVADKFWCVWLCCEVVDWVENWRVFVFCPINYF